MTERPGYTPKELAKMPETRHNRPAMIETGKKIMLSRMKDITPEEVQILDSIN